MLHQRGFKLVALPHGVKILFPLPRLANEDAPGFPDERVLLVNVEWRPSCAG